MDCDDDPNISRSFDGSFDPCDTSSWHFGDASREDVVKLLEEEQQDGVFCIRESSSQRGNLVLSVRETGNGKDQPISHYLIQVKRNQAGHALAYHLGDQVFMSMVSLLTFYKNHYLDSTFLLRPAPRKYAKVLAKYDYKAEEEDDLSFKRNEILYVIKKEEQKWWLGKNALGISGLIPANYVEEINTQICSSGDDNSPSNRSSSNSASTVETESSVFAESYVPTCQKSLPAFARVKMARMPNAYDKKALKLKVGDRIKVLETHPAGMWVGELDGKTGEFPFTYVQWEDDCDR